MSDKTKVKYVSDVEVMDSDVAVKRPFKISKENKRRYVRLEISSPVSLRNLKENIGMLSDEKLYNLEGYILNISAGGVLVEIKEQVNEQDFVLMKFTLQDVETISNVLGIVKRADMEADYTLAGIEFVSKDLLMDRLSEAELELLESKVSNFHESVQETLAQYFYKK